MYSPPYQITAGILNQVASISSKLGEIKAAHLSRPSPELRKKNRIKTIQSSLAIEGNTLSVEQITALFEQKRVIGPKKDIQEVLNAIDVYSKLDKFEPFNYKSFLKAHKILMDGLMEFPGKYRNQAVGIVKGASLAHLAPPASKVHSLMLDLFEYVRKSDDLMLIKSCVFHYEMEFIHPFLDGNGRMGRLWQPLLLMKEYPVFEFLPLETTIKDKQEAYYNALAKSDKEGQSTSFIQFMLSVINASLEHLLLTQNVSLTALERIQRFYAIIKEDMFNRQDYMRVYKEISTATASRDLKRGVEEGILIKLGDKRLTKYKFGSQ